MSALSCGSGTTLPLAREDELASFYPQHYAPFDVPHGPLASAMALMQRVRDCRFPLAELAATSGSRTLLDVGCGRGDLAASWLARGWRVLGIEPSPEAAATAAGRGAEIIGQTLSATQLEPESLDAVVFRHSLEHVTEPRLDLHRVQAALRRGGRLAVIVPNWGSWQRRAFGEYWFPLELPRHRAHFTATGLRAAIGSAGFEQSTCAPRPHSSPPPGVSSSASSTGSVPTPACRCWLATRPRCRSRSSLADSMQRRRRRFPARGGRPGTGLGLKPGEDRPQPLA